MEELGSEAEEEDEKKGWWKVKAKDPNKEYPKEPPKEEKSKWTYEGHKGNALGNLLLTACDAGDRLKAQELIKVNADPNYAARKDATLNQVGWTGLLYASDKGHRGVVSLLASALADLNAQTQVGWSALMLATYRGNKDMVRHLLRLKADPSLKQMYVVKKEKEDPAVKALMQSYEAKEAVKEEIKIKVALPKSRKEELKEKLHDLRVAFEDIYAIEMQDKAVGIMKSIIKEEEELRSNPKLQKEQRQKRQEIMTLDEPIKDNPQLWTYLHAAVVQGNATMCRFLLDLGANVNAATKTGNTPLHMAAQHLNTEEGREIVMHLLEAKADIHRRNFVQKLSAIDNLLMTASNNDPKEMLWIRTFVPMGELRKSPPNSEQRDTPLLPNTANTNGRPRKSPSKVSPDNTTAAMIASWMGHTEILHMLIEARADLFATDKDEKDAEDWAIWEDRTEIVKIIQEGKIEQRKWEERERKRREAMAKKFLEACEFGDYLTVNEMLMDPRVEIEYKYQNGYTALMIAARAGYWQVVRSLLKAGASLHIRDDGGGTALMKAAAGGHKRVVNEIAAYEKKLKLKKEESCLNLQDADGWTALMLASIHGNTHTVVRLCELGADLDLIQKGGHTAQQWAVMEEQWEVAKELQTAREKRKFAAKNAAKVEEEVKHILASKFGDQIPDGTSAVMLAAMRGHSGVVDALLHIKANINITDSRGMTAYDWAVKHKHRSAA